MHTFKNRLGLEEVRGLLSHRFLIGRSCSPSWRISRARTRRAQVRLSCDGTEELCLTLTDLAAIQANGATIAGDVSSDGFVPSDQGGLDWHFVPSDGLCSGRMEVDVQGLLPQMSSSDPEQISVFETCGKGAEGIQVVGLQRMMLNYHGNYYATTDFASTSTAGSLGSGPTDSKPRTGPRTRLITS